MKNLNIRCIEIKDNLAYLKSNQKKNLNIRCIEMP